MISLDDLPELAADVRSGALLWRDAYLSLLMLLVDNDVDEVVMRLPAPLRAKFTSDLKDSFGNRVDANELIWIDNAVGEPEQKVRIVEKARRWLQKHSGIAP